MSQAEKEYSVHAVSGLPAGVFGVAYVVCAATDLTRDVFRGEWFILTQRPSESLLSGAIEISEQQLPEELGKIDINFAKNEALAQARLDLADLLEKRAKEVSRGELAYLPFELKRTASPLVGCWMRGQFIAQLRQIREQTTSHYLRSYLIALEQVKMLRRAG